MKVLLIDVYNYNKGGAETVCFNTGKMLEENGHEVIYFTLKWNKNLPSKFEKYFPESKETRKGLFKQVINLRNYFYYPDAAKKLEGLILAEKPDIAHIHLMWGQISPSIFPVLKRHHIPIAFTIHDYRIVCPAYSFKNGSEEICERCEGKYFYKCFTNKCTKGDYIQSFIMAMEQYFRNAFFNPSKNINGLIYVSNFAKQVHEKYMPQLQHIYNIVMHNFIYDMMDEGKYPNDEKYYLYFGRLSREKGILTLLKAFKNLPNIQLKIVGTGPLEDNLKKFANDNRLKNVEFLGYKSGEELLYLKRNAYFVIVPSEWYENNPMSIIESYGMRVPVIGSNIGGIPEIIKNNNTGFIFESRNENNLIEKIIKADKLTYEEYKIMSDNTIKFAKQDMSKDAYYKRLIPFYNRLISENK